MNIKRFALLVFGIILFLLGGLWFLQGTALIHLDPVMCVADCEPITGVTPLWAVVGFLTCAGGILLLRAGVKRK